MTKPTIKQFEIKTIRERAYCGDCNNELRFTGTVNWRHPSDFEHRCISCDNQVSLLKKYPRDFQKAVEVA